MNRQEFEELELQVQQSELPLKSYLQQIGVSYSTYHYWRRKCSVDRSSIKHELAPISFKQAFTEVSIRPTTGIKPLYTTIATVTMNLIVSAAIVLLNPYVTVYISYKIPPFALSVHIPDVSTSIYVEVDSKVLLGLPSCDKAFVR